MYDSIALVNISKLRKILFSMHMLSRPQTSIVKPEDFMLTQTTLPTFCNAVILLWYSIGFGILYRHRAHAESTPRTEAVPFKTLDVSISW